MVSVYDPVSFEPGAWEAQERPTPEGTVWVSVMCDGGLRQLAGLGYQSLATADSPALDHMPVARIMAAGPDILAALKLCRQTIMDLEIGIMQDGGFSEEAKRYVPKGELFDLIDAAIARCLS